MKLPIWYATFDNEPDPAAEAAAAAAAAAAALAAGGGTPKTFTQDEVNAIMKKEKDKAKVDREKTIQDLEKLQASVQLTEQQKQQMEQQIESLRSQNMTTEEQARRAKEKLENDFKGQLAQTQAEKDRWAADYQNLKIGYEINTAAAQNGVLDNSVRFVEALLRPQTRLVPDLGDDGKPNGEHTAKVRFQDVDKNGKPVIVDYTIPEAVKRMKEKPDEYGNLFRATTAGGAGASSGTPGKKPNPANMSMDEYMATRKANPAALGLM